MGRNKIKIERINNERTRLATFNKRKTGLLKKAMELSILCGCELALIVIGSNKLTQYSSSNMDKLLLRYTDGGFEEPQAEPLTNEDYPQLFGKKNKTKESPQKRLRTDSPGLPGTTNIQPAEEGRSFGQAPAHGMPTSPVLRSTSPVVNKPASPTRSMTGVNQQYSGMQQNNGQLSYGYPSTRTAQLSNVGRMSSRPPSSSFYSNPSGPGRSSPHQVPLAGGSPPTKTYNGGGVVYDAPNRSPHSNPTTPPGQAGPEAAHRAAHGRPQEHHFSQKLNKKNLSLAIPDAGVQSNFASAFSARQQQYTPGFTAMGVPSGAPFMSDSEMNHSASVLPSPSSFFVETPTHDMHQQQSGLPSLAPWGWFSPRPDTPQERFLSRDLNHAMNEGLLAQFGMTKYPTVVGEKRKLHELKAN